MSFGTLLKSARKRKGFSQRQLANLVRIDTSYLSKLENNRADYPPSEPVLAALAYFLSLDSTELGYLAGRLPKQDEVILGMLYKIWGSRLSALFHRLYDEPDFSCFVFGLESSWESGVKEISEMSNAPYHP